MQKEQGRLFFQTRGDEFDRGVLACIRRGITLSERSYELTEEQRELAARLDEETAGEEGQLFGLSTDEAQLAAKAISRSCKSDISNNGGLLNYNSLSDNSRMGLEALPVIQQLADTV